MRSDEMKLVTKLAKLSMEQIANLDYSKLPFKTFWMPSEEFVSLYGNTHSGITLFRRNHPHLEGIAWKVDEDGVKINNQFFIYCQELRKRIWLQNHELFYALEELGFLAQGLAEYLSQKTGKSAHTWANYISQDMWELPTPSPLMYQIPSMALAFLIYVGKMYLDITEGGNYERYENFARKGRKVREVQRECEDRHCAAESVAC